MEIIIGVMIFLIGLCVGSFVNMLLYRTAMGYKLKVCKVNKVCKVKNGNRSFCDYCGRQLRWYENIPVVSWVIQKGRTRCCHNPLPRSYPIVELLMGGLFLVVYVGGHIGPPLQLLVGLVIITFLVFAAVFDAKYMILPDFSTIILVVCAVFVGQLQELPLRILSAAGGTAFLGFLYLLTKGKGMGLGDVKLAIFMGLFLGWPKIVIAFYTAFIAGAVVGIVLMMMGKIKKGKTMIPFGPFLILGVVVAWWWGERIILFLK